MPPRLAQPPRRVPMSLVIANLFHPISQIGWFVVGFGALFFWGFVANADFSFVTFRGEMRRTWGEITRVEKTNASEGGSKGRSGTPIYASHYEYSAAGRHFSGIAYELGSTHSAGDRVDVEYLVRDPKASRVSGMRRAMFSPAVSFVTIFPLIGAGLVFFFLRSGMRRTALLRDGVVAEGKLVGKRATNTRINRQTVFELTFEFTGRDGLRHHAKARTHQPQRLEDEAMEPLLYDPANPSRVYLLDELPSRPSLSPDGELEGRSKLAFALLILPLLVIAGNLLMAYARFGRFE